MGLTGIVSFDRHYLRYQSAMTSMLRFAPLLFVVLWSTGFIGAKLGLPHAEPLTFLLIRYALVIVLMAVIAIAMRAPWPADRRSWFHIGVSGLLVHGIYLGGVFVAIAHGLKIGRRVWCRRLVAGGRRADWNYCGHPVPKALLPAL